MFYGDAGRCVQPARSHVGASHDQRISHTHILRTKCPMHHAPAHVARGRTHCHYRVPHQTDRQSLTDRILTKLKHKVSKKKSSTDECILPDIWKFVDTEIFTCASMDSFSCLPCLTRSATFAAPPPCPSDDCDGACSIRFLPSITSTCYNRHDIPGDTNFWMCDKAAKQAAR